MPKRTIASVFGVKYHTQKSLQAEIKRRLRPYTVGVNSLLDDIELSDEDRAWFDEYFTQLDPEVAQGFGINRIWRTTHEGQVGNHLKVEWRDGRMTWPSWKRAMKPQQIAAKDRATKALRASVDTQKQLAVAEAFAIPGYQCPKTGRLLDSLTCDVHHDGVEFAEISAEFLAIHSLTITTLPIVENQDSGGWRVSPELEQTWQQFHWEKARLVVVCREWHRKFHGGKDGQAATQGNSTPERGCGPGKVA